MRSNYSHCKTKILQATGRVGRFIVEELLKTGKHTVTAITRAESTSSLPPGVQAKKVDYSDPTTLISALQGQDALMITMSVLAPPDTQTKLISAAASAGVPWVLPNEFGGDPLNVEQGKDIFLGAAKAKYREQIEELGKSSWIGIACGFWYEFSLAGGPYRYGFDFKEKSLVMFDEGTTKICTSTWPQCGRAVAALLSLKIQPEKEGEVSLSTHFKNKPAYINSFTVSQKDMLESVLKATGDKVEDWKITKVDVKEYYKEGMEEFQKGNRMGFAKLLYGRSFFPDDSGDFGATRGLDNGVLGLPKEDFDEFTKLGVEMSEKGVD